MAPVTRSGERAETNAVDAEKCQTVVNGRFLSFPFQAGLTLFFAWSCAVIAVYLELHTPLSTRSGNTTSYRYAPGPMAAAGNGFLFGLVWPISFPVVSMFWGMDCILRSAIAVAKAM